VSQLAGVLGLTVNVNGGTLATEHGVGNIGGTVSVSIANGKDTSLVGAHGAGNLNLSVIHLKAHLVRESRGLVGGKVNKESIALDGLALGEVNEELVVLLVLVVVSVLAAILDTLER